MTTKSPRRFGPEWWSCYAAAYAADACRIETVLSQQPRSELSDFDRVRQMRSSIAERAVVVADDAICGFAEALDGECVGRTWSELPEEEPTSPPPRSTP